MKKPQPDFYGSNTGTCTLNGTKTLAIFHTCNKNDIRAVFCYTWLKQ